MSGIPSLRGSLKLTLLPQVGPIDGFLINKMSDPHDIENKFYHLQEVLAPLFPL